MDCSIHLHGHKQVLLSEAKNLTFYIEEYLSKCDVKVSACQGGCSERGSDPSICITDVCKHLFRPCSSHWRQNTETQTVKTSTKENSVGEYHT